MCAYKELRDGGKKGKKGMGKGKGEEGLGDTGGMKQGAGGGRKSGNHYVQSCFTHAHLCNAIESSEMLVRRS